MKNIVIAAFVLAANSTAFAGEYHGDDTLGWISGYQGHATGYSVMTGIPADDNYVSEFHGDTTLALINTPETERAEFMAVAVTPAIGSRDSSGLLDHIFPNGHVEG